jgi:diguanylate cyclase (GGDEF)-like protein
MLADIDNFKKINDELGHIAGDTVLESLASLFESSVRSIDIIGRYGGEEFGFILPETDAEQSRVIGERIRKAVEERVFRVESFGEILKLRLTISIGISTFPMTGSDTSRTVIQSTDLALYRAKSLGKNRVVHFDDLREQL